MKLYFSGFSLNDESKLFDDIIDNSDFVVSGFSYGAQKAFEYALNCDTRIDKLQLFSPAFFQNKDKKYKRLQLMFFNKDKALYCDNFLKNVIGDSSIDLKPYLNHGSQKELEELLYYNWEKSDLENLVNKGIQIEIYLGSNDKIIDSKDAYDFFKNYATVYLLQNKGHIL
jgi:hypothetical protein